MTAIKERLEDLLEDYAYYRAEETKAQQSGNHRDLISARCRVGNALDQLVKLGYDIKELN